MTILFLCLMTASLSYGQVTVSADPELLPHQVPGSPVELRAVHSDDLRASDRPTACFADAKLDFQSFFATHVKYPELAADNAMEGLVVLRLWVAADGSVKVLGIDRSDYAFLDKAVLEAAQELPSLLPAVIDGQAVGQSVLIPVHFSLE